MKVERLPPLPPAEKNYHQARKRIHFICFLIFVALPFFNILRFDIPGQRFWFAGAEIWISEFSIAFFTLMFLMFVIAAGAIIWGRIYCSYLCPQMIFSEWASATERYVSRFIGKRWAKWPAQRKLIATRVALYTVLWIASVFLAFVFTAYFVDPRDLLGRLASLDVVTAGGITGTVVTLLTFLDLAFLRQKFCVTVCPYGYLQGMLVDKNSLLVTYRDENKTCIECKKCVRVCEMGIDIRKSPYQIECVHCGECIDACEDVLRKIGRPGLIAYTWGERPKTEIRESWLRRMGIRDAKRVAIMVILLFYGAGLSVALAMRKPVLVQIAPDRTVLYTKAPDGRIVNRMRLRLANRTSRETSVRLWTESLAGAEVALQQNPVTLGPGQTVETTFELRAPQTAGSTDVNRFRFIAQTAGENRETFDMTFIMPVRK
ncbi:MAG: 4Fe-4S binding protein [Bryobacteraceae bacterium]|nr:4Fe-4S binding protein [Bryobacteraceae bacterium]